MQKLFRSLIAIGGLAGLVACGDDVSITPPPPPALTISGAPVTAIQVGAKVQLSANQAVTWTSSAPGVASVDGTGLVTAVAAGVASITATSTADVNQKASVTITVSALVNATISLQNITRTGTAGETVNNNNVSGSIDVNLNVVPGDQVVQKVEVIIDNNTTTPACSQTLSGAQAAVSAEADVEVPDAVIVSCQINTAAFDATTGAVKYLNGAHTLTARAIITGGTQTATPSTSLTFNNTSGFIALVSNTNTVGGPASAINPLTGLKWIQGNVTLKLAAVNYTAGGATVSSINAAFLGKTFTDTPDAGTQIFTIDFPNSGSGALNLVNYQTPSGSSQSIPVVTSSALSSGSQGPTQVLNVGPKADSLGLARVDSTRVDNVAPASPTTAAFATWVNAAFTFDTTKTGVSGVSDTGVDNVTIKFYVIKGTNPTTLCDVTGMTEVANAGTLAETLTSTEYDGKIVITDALGNKRCAELFNTFGVDKGAPTVDVIDAPDNGAALATVVAPDDQISLTISDTLSGVRLPNPLNLSIKRITGVASSATTCLVGATSACNQVQAPNPSDSRGGSTANGYYTFTVSASDSAGNASANTTRTFLYDSIAPTQTGAPQQPATYTGGGSATFTVTVADNLDLAAPTGILTYTGRDTLEFAGSALGTFGFDAFTTTGTASFTVPNLMRCLNATNDTTAAGGVKVSTFNFLVNDLAGNSLDVGATAIPAIAVPNCGTVGNSKFDGTFIALQSSDTTLNLDGNPDPKTTTLQVRAETVASESVQPFSRVDFYVRDASGRLVLIGSDASASVGAQTTIRPFTYTFAWTPTATGSYDIVAIGVDSNGDAMVVSGLTIVVGT